MEYNRKATAKSREKQKRKKDSEKQTGKDSEILSFRSGSVLDNLHENNQALVLTFSFFSFSSYPPPPFFFFQFLYPYVNRDNIYIYIYMHIVMTKGILVWEWWRCLSYTNNKSGQLSFISCLTWSFLCPTSLELILLTSWLAKNSLTGLWAQLLPLLLLFSQFEIQKI